MRIPSHLVIVLKRYSYEHGRNGFSVSKNPAAIEAPALLDMKDHMFNSGNNANAGGENGGTVYELGSLCVHLGNTPSGGHYIALVKLRDKWWRISDDSVKLCTDHDWKQAEENGYILFYKKKS